MLKMETRDLRKSRLLKRFALLKPLCWLRRSFCCRNRKSQSQPVSNKRRAERTVGAAGTRWTNHDAHGKSLCASKRTSRRKYFFFFIYPASILISLRPIYTCWSRDFKNVFLETRYLVPTSTEQEEEYLQNELLESRNPFKNKKYI